MNLYIAEVKGGKDGKVTKEQVLEVDKLASIKGCELLPVRAAPAQPKVAKS